MKNKGTRKKYMKSMNQKKATVNIKRTKNQGGGNRKSKKQIRKLYTVKKIK